MQLLQEFLGVIVALNQTAVSVLVQKNTLKGKSEPEIFSKLASGPDENTAFRHSELWEKMYKNFTVYWL